MLAGLFLALLVLLKFSVQKMFSFRTSLLFITAIYISFFFPGKLHALVFMAWSYGIYYLFEYVFRVSNKLWGSLLLALPMVFIKADLFTSFIQFAGLSYITFRVIQIYIDNTNTNKPVNIFDFLIFMLFPPTLLIGPIDRFQRFRNDLAGGWAQLNGNRLLSGFEMIVLGVLQKFVLAELVNRYWLKNLDPGSHETTDMLSNMYAYSFFLFFDFAGYSSLACGLGRMFGIDVPENFTAPFLARNPQDFWKRWHITLGDWLRDYIFRPYYKWISGFKSLKKFPLLKQNAGLFLTFLVMGLWNGFQNNFILSGCIFGLYSVVHNSYVYYSRKKGKDVIFGNLHPAVTKWLSIFTMFNLVAFALYVFSGRFPLL